jgi:hypothetical protein
MMRPLEATPESQTHGPLINRKYEGPQLHRFVENYVKGCAKCQESKVITHMKHAPLYHFDTHVKQGPFQYISMDLITDLPPLKQIRCHTNHCGSRMLKSSEIPAL